MHPSWRNQLSQEFIQPYFSELSEFVEQAYETGVCYPPKKYIFASFISCPFEKVKVVIIGQDPYHGPGQADGLCFSVRVGMTHPPSLRNIFKEIESDLGIPYPESGHLGRWAEQGVLLLNSTLTVGEHKAGSHQNKGWEMFTDAVIEKLSKEKKKLVFLLWGGFAKKKSKLIDESKHVVLKSGHPSPLSANRGFWFGNEHFSKTNKILERISKTSISW